MEPIDTSRFTRPCYIQSQAITGMTTALAFELLCLQSKHFLNTISNAFQLLPFSTHWKKNYAFKYISSATWWKLSEKEKKSYNKDGIKVVSGLLVTPRKQVYHTDSFPPSPKKFGYLYDLVFEKGVYNSLNQGFKWLANLKFKFLVKSLIVFSCCCFQNIRYTQLW